MPRRTYEVQVGERYGLLTVSEIGLRVEPHAAQRARGHAGCRAAWTVCECGRTRLAEVGRLVVGKIKSCGKCQPPPVIVSTDEAINRPTAAEQPADPDTSAAPAPRRPRGGRPPAHIDVSAFEPIMAEALRGYALDSGILVKMMQNATQIRIKRRTWAIRSELRLAEAEARDACVAAGPRTCLVMEPCGTGPSCPYSRGDLAELVGIPSLPRKSGSSNRATRPQPRPEHVPGLTYSIEAALLPLTELRASRGTLDSDEAHADSAPS